MRCSGFHVATPLAGTWPWLALSLLAGCHDGPAEVVMTVDEDRRLRFALQSLGEPPRPPDEPRSEPRIALGHLLFFDPILSGEQDVSCGICHHPAFGFADGRQFSAGVSGVGLGPARVVSVSSVTGLPIGLVARNAPTVLNAAFNADERGVPSHFGVQFWDGRALGLEEQARGPITSRAEMAGDAYPADLARDSVVARLRDILEYVSLFQAAFPLEARALPGADIVSMDTYGRAVAAYERELVTRDTPFDRYARGDNGALTAEQKEGLDLFFTKGRCSLCHNGPMFSNYQFVVLGVPQVGSGMSVITGDDVGREEHTGNPADRYAFRTPTLRNVALTAPYMHDGFFATLEEVVRFYDRGAEPRHPEVSDDALDPQVRDPLALSDAEVLALVAFMTALTDPGSGIDPMLRAVPAAVPSGLPPVFGVRAAGGARLRGATPSPGARPVAESGARSAGDRRWDR